MVFEWNRSALVGGKLVYSSSEYSVDFEAASPEVLAERIGAEGVTSLSIMTLQIEVGIQRGDVLYPWGLFPSTTWESARLVTPVFCEGRVRVGLVPGTLERGVSVSLPNCASWRTRYDADSGWICIGNATPGRGAVAVEYATGAGVVLVGSQLDSLWLHPHIES